MGKIVLALVVVGVVAVGVKTVTGDINGKLAAVRNPREAKVDPNAPGLVLPRDGEEATLLPFEDPLGYFRLMAPGTPGETQVDRLVLHGIGRAFRLTDNTRQLRLHVSAEFVGTDEPNTPRQTLGWLVEKGLARSQKADLFDRVKFSRLRPGVEAADYAWDWRGNGPSAHRYRLILVKKWLYTLVAHGVPDGLDGADVAAFFDTFEVTEKALAHPDGGALKP